MLSVALNYSKKAITRSSHVNCHVLHGYESDAVSITGSITKFVRNVGLSSKVSTGSQRIKTTTRQHILFFNLQADDQ